MSFLGAAIDRVVQVDVVQPELVVGLGGNGDFFDGAGAIVAGRGALSATLRADWLCGLDKEVFGDPQRLALLVGGDVIRPSLSMFTVPL